MSEFSERDPTLEQSRMFNLIRAQLTVYGSETFEQIMFDSLQTGRSRKATRKLRQAALAVGLEPADEQGFKFIDGRSREDVDSAVLEVAEQLDAETEQMFSAFDERIGEIIEDDTGGTN